MNRRLPVTLVGGFLGAGKTSFLHQAISGHEGGHLAIFVENPGPLNLDAKALGGLLGAMRRSHDRVFEIPATDEAAQIEWLSGQLRECALAGQFERVLIEVSGTANAARLGRCFDPAGKLAPWGDLQQIICLVDALELGQTLGNSSADTALGDLQRAQAAGATLLILNKCDLMEDAERQVCTRLLRSLNPEARIVETDYGEVPPEIWSHPAPLGELGLALERRPPPRAGTDSAALSLGSALYRTYRPFHPARFWEWFNDAHPGLLRVKGLVWLATRNLLVGGISRTRRQNACGAAGIWWAALPREEWPEEPAALERMQQTWREPYGDRRQELVLIGDATRLPGIVRELEACLLSAEEYARPLPEWKAWPDPFPAWDMEEG